MSQTARQLTPLLDHYLAEHARVARNLPGAELDTVAETRHKALQRFVDNGFPAASDEDWKYSDTRLLQKTSFELATAVPVDKKQIAARLPEDMDGPRLVFVNGYFSATLSELAALPDGVRLENLGAQPQSLRLTNSRDLPAGHHHALLDLNTAFATDGVCLQLAAGTVIEQPLHLLFVNAAHEDGLMMHCQNRIELGANSQASVIEHSVSLTDTSCFSTQVTHISLAAGARLEHIRLQECADSSLQVGATLAQLARDSTLTLHSFDLGARWLRHDSNVRLTEPGASIHMNGLYVPTGRQHMDNHTRIEHEAPHCLSRETYKGILAGAARGVFNGRIVVHKDAQKTDSEQSSAVLLLSPKAEIDAKPELEIYADDVKCKHGATVGQLDEDAIYYLQSRGLGAAEARNLLTWSFADTLIQQLGNEILQKAIEAALLARLPQGELLEDLL